MEWTSCLQAIVLIYFVAFFHEGHGKPAHGKRCQMGVQTTGGKCCEFPFVFEGKTYHSCVTLNNKNNNGDNNNNRPWCATTKNYDTDNQWGNCKAKGASNIVLNPFVNFTAKPDDVDVFVGAGNTSVTLRWGYSVQHMDYRDKYDFAVFLISFGWINENARDCWGKRVTVYTPIVAKQFRQDTGVVIHGRDKRNRITTTEDLKAEFTLKGLKLSDTGKYYCRLSIRELVPFTVLTTTSQVNVRVLADKPSVQAP